MEQVEDKVLVCRQCGKEFTFASSEQEYYIQKGWSQPSRCPQCRSARRKVNQGLVCSGCGVAVERDNPAYCSACVDNLKLEAELKQHGHEEKIKELENRLESLGKLEQRLASATTELEKGQQANRELQDRLTTLELKNSGLAKEVASWRNLETSVQQLREQFEAFQQSYAGDIDKLTRLLLDVQSRLIQKRQVSLLHSIKLKLSGKMASQTKSSMNHSIHMDTGTKPGEIVDDREEGYSDKLRKDKELN